MIISNVSGNTSEGTVTITVDSYESVTDVTYGGVALADVVEDTPTTITATFPRGGFELGSSNSLTVTDSSGVSDPIQVVFNPRAGMSFQTLSVPYASLDVDSPFSGDTGYDELATGDQISIGDSSSPGGYAVSITTTGEVTLTGAEGETTPQVVPFYWLDASDGYSPQVPDRSITLSLPLSEPVVKGVGNLKVNSGVLKTAILGDSISAQGYDDPNISRAQGWMTQLNTIFNHKFNVQLHTQSYNLAVGGEKLEEIDNDKETKLSGIDADIIFIMSGTNDIGGSATLEDMIGYFDSIVYYIRENLNIPIVFLTPPPRTQSAAPLSAGQKQTLLDFNNYVLEQDDPGNKLCVIDVFNALITPGTTEPKPTLFRDESGDLVHPNVAGAIKIAQTVSARLHKENIDPLKEPDPTKPNPLSEYGSIEGTGGRLSGTGAGVAPDGMVVFGSGGTQPRISTMVDSGCNLYFEPLDGDGDTSNITLQFDEDIEIDPFKVGDEVVFWAIVSTGEDCARMDGPWVQTTEDNPGGDITYYGVNKAGPSVGHNLSNIRRVMMTTPSFVIRPGTTGFSSTRITCRVSAATGNTGIANFTVHSAGISRVSSLRENVTRKVRRSAVVSTPVSSPVGK